LKFAQRTGEVSHGRALLRHLFMVMFVPLAADFVTTYRTCPR
jgi:hypothetical protein